LEAEAASSRKQTDRALARLPDRVVVYGDTEERLPHIVCLGVQGVEAEAVLLGLDQAGIAAHSGSACSSESLEPSPVLEAMSVDALDPRSYAGADVLIVGAPFDGGTSHRPGARFGPHAIRTTDYLPLNGSRPHLGMGVDPLIDLRVLDGGDVLMPAGEIERSLYRLEQVVGDAVGNGVFPLVLGGDHSIGLPDVTGVARHHPHGRLGLVHF